MPMSLHHLKEFDTYMGLSTRGSDRYGANTSWTAAGFDTDFFDFGPWTMSALPRSLQAGVRYSSCLLRLSPYKTSSKCPSMQCCIVLSILQSSGWVSGRKGVQEGTISCKGGRQL